ncbi:hypothetical protein B1B_11114, partial [mine drainage metagenome]
MSPEAALWNISSYPLDRVELYPNMCNTYDFPWHTVKKEIAKKNKELTSLWMVGPKNRNKALNDGIYSWEQATPQALGINTPHRGNILQDILDINQQETKIINCPEFIDESWKSKITSAFYIDFEFYNGILGEIDDLYNQKVNNIIYLIGLGYWCNK